MSSSSKKSSSSSEQKQPAKKKAKLEVDLEEAAQTAWQHYRNYQDSAMVEIEGDGDDEGDTDELEELLNVVLKPHVENKLIQPFLQDSEDLDLAKATNLSLTTFLPILMSVSYYHLADVAIGECLEEENDREKNLSKSQHLLEQSLYWYPSNAATWSMGANFGRMLHVLPVPIITQWYERSVQCAVQVRKDVLTALDNEQTPDEVKEWMETLLLNRILGVDYVVDEDDEKGDKEQEGDADKKPTSANIKKKKKTTEEGLEASGANDEGYFSSSAAEETARFMASMLHSTAGRHDAAKTHLQHFAVTHRIHPNVWQLSPSSTTRTNDEDRRVQKYSRGILPQRLYQRLCQLFAPKANYWKESDYDHRGYYSYYMDKPNYSNDNQSSFVVKHLLDDVIWNHLYPIVMKQYACSNMIVGAEWWVHTRSLQANLGHNLHFDTDEALLAAEGKITHPVYSTVLYLTGGENGGATMVLDQTPDSTEVATQAWRCVPEDNTLLVFPGNLLHGVLPCPGSASEAAKKVDNNCNSDDKSDNFINEVKKQWIPPPSENDSSHRLTFLVGFWTRRVPDKMKQQKMYGPCGPLPPATNEHTWVKEIHQEYGKETKQDFKSSSLVKAVDVPVITPAWEVLKTTSNDINKSEKDNSEQQLLLEIPKGIDHRFFAEEVPKCFRDSLFEEDDDDDGEEDEDEGDQQEEI